VPLDKLTFISIQMAKLFKNILLSEFKSEKTHDANKIYFITDKGMMWANGNFYSHSTQDTVSGTDANGIIEVLAPTVNLTSTSQLTVKGFDTSLLDIDRFTLVNTNDINNIIVLGDQIQKFGTLTQIELSKGDSVCFVKKGTVWTVEIAYGEKLYIPSLIPASGDTGAISIDSTGASTTVKYNDMKAWSDTTALLNAETLNKSFPDVSIGFQVVCANVNRIYEKVNVLGDWVATETKSVTLGGGAA